MDSDTTPSVLGDNTSTLPILDDNEPEHCEICDSTQDVQAVYVNMPGLFTGLLATCKKCRIPEDW